MEIDLGFRIWKKGNIGMHSCNDKFKTFRIEKSQFAYLHVVGNTGIDHKMVCHMAYMLLYIVTRILRQRCLLSWLLCASLLWSWWYGSGEHEKKCMCATTRPRPQGLNENAHLLLAITLLWCPLPQYHLVYYSPKTGLGLVHWKDSDAFSTKNLDQILH